MLSEIAPITMVDVTDHLISNPGVVYLTIFFNFWKAFLLIRCYLTII